MVASSCEVGLAPIACRKLKERNVQRTTMIAVALLLGAGVAATTAKADMNYGPIVDTAKGLCFKSTPSNDLGFGFWSECPKPAAAVTVRRPHPKHS
jgi:hypothetical protein